MNYIRDFYKQSGRFVAHMNYFDSGAAGAIFGLSGDDTFALEVANGCVYCEGFAVTSLDESDSIFVSIAGDGGNVTAWIDDRPVYSKSATSFNSIYCSSPSSFEFTETLFGEQPDLDVSFSGWNGRTGYMWLANNGDDTLQINSALFENSFIRVNSFASSIAPGGSGIIELLYDNNSSTSGTGQLVLGTNAGQFNLSQFLEYEWVNNNGSLSIYFDSGIYNPSGAANFFIHNRYLRELELGIFLDEDMNYVLYDDSGNQLLLNSGEEIYLSRNRYAEIPGTGTFVTDIYAEVFGPTSFAIPYQGNFTGVGGKLNATGVTWREGIVNLTIFPEGDLTYNYQTLASSIISGELYYSTQLTGALTETVGPGSGQWHFYQQVDGPVDTAYHYSTLQTIAPSVFTTFTGFVDRVLDLESSIIGEYSFDVVDTVLVSEGSPSFLDLWEFITFDIDRGTEYYKDEGWYDSYGYKNSGLTYRVPADSRVSGQVRFNNDYDEQILSKMILRVTDFNSINETISIESR